MLLQLRSSERQGLRLADLSILGALFTLSGASGLIVEQVFEKLLTTVVGSAVESGAIVLAVFFGGLFAGGALYAALERRYRDAYAVYGGLELVVSASALVLALLLSPIQTWSSRLIQLAGHDGAEIFLARIAVATLWMGPPTVAMGATYPAMVRIVGGLDPTRVSRSMTAFYALNLLGAVLSAALAPYVLFPRVGLDGALLAVGLIQLGVAALAFFLGRTRARSTDEPQGSSESTPVEASAHLGTVAQLLRRHGTPFLLVGALVSGFVVFALEVLWFHLIGVVLGMSTYAFALMLAVVLLGLFLGSTIVSTLPARSSTGDLTLPLALGASAAVLTAVGTLWDDIPRWLFECHVGYSNFPCGPQAIDFWSAEHVRLRLSAVVVGIPSVCLGMVYPSLFRTSIYPREHADTMASVLGATNALGSVLGALTTSFVLLPRFGSEVTYRGLALAPAALAILAALALPLARLTRGGICVASGGLVLGSVAVVAPWNRLDLTSGVHVYLTRQHVTEDSKLRFWHEDATGGIVTVVERPRGDRVTKTLLTNGKFQGNDGGEAAAQTGLALLPAMATPARDRALVVGYGTGHSAAILHAAGFRELDIAEISRGILEAARAEFVSLHQNVLHEPGVHLYLEDARNHLLRNTNPYDILSMELSSVWFAGVNNLYSREYYELARRNLKKHGILQQWIQLHHLAREEIVSVLATVRSVFPHVELYLLGGQGIILASEDPIVLATSSSAHLPEALRAHLAPLAGRPFWPGVDGLGRTRLLADEDVVYLSEWAKTHGVPLTTDANRYLEYATPLHALEREWTAEYTARALLALLPPERRLAGEEALAPNH